uniref:Uncharacterized protein n=1 Tax=Talaromyces marneffei PM1 TaxID=1077442 RepID=A0A093UZ58_TALMA
MNDLTAGKRAEIFQALHGSCLVWTHLSENSQEAQKAAEAVRSVLNKMHHADINLSPSVDTGSILDMTMNSSMIIPSNSVAGSSSAMIQLLDQQTSGHGANIPHSTSSPHLPNHLAHHSGIGEESQMQYDPLSPTQLKSTATGPDGKNGQVLSQKICISIVRKYWSGFRFYRIRQFLPMRNP